VAEVVPIDRGVFADSTRLRAALQGTEAVLHLAGVNRAKDEGLLQENIRLTQELTAALDAIGARPVIVYANSIQAGSASPFGQTKQAAAAQLAEWGTRAGAAVVDVHLPNLFGEHGRPNYNSVVATFCHQLANAGKPAIIEDRSLSLLHVQDAVDQLLDLIEQPKPGVVTPEGRAMQVSEILERLRGFHDLYVTGEFPDLADRFDRALFNTYRSFCFPQLYPIYPQLRSDNRGGLYESVRSRGGQSQVFFSTTHPGVTRGNHFHLRKVERFLVLGGSGMIALRRLFGDEIVRFEVSGERPAIIDMPTMWTHSIANTGSTELMTLFWTDEVLDTEKPDTYAEPVEVARATA